MRRRGALHLLLDAERRPRRREAVRVSPGVHPFDPSDEDALGLAGQLRQVERYDGHRRRRGGAGHEQRR
jgi:hypothetical protein